MFINSHLGPCVCTQSPKYLEMAQGHISLSVILLSTQGSEEYRRGLGVKVPNLGGLVRVVVLVPYLWYSRSKFNYIPNAFVE
jgi:hypothetical protein